MLMIKSNGGSGTLQNAKFHNFAGHTNAYTLNLDAFWSSQSTGAGDGVQYHNLTFSHWRGTCSDGTRRAPIQVLCPPKVPCYDIRIQDVNIWTESGASELNKCWNAFGEGACLKSGSGRGTFTTTVTVRTMAAA
jgi:rhamnogalacturonan hydrolase